MEIEKQARNCRIMVVDDVIANISLLENILHRMGYKQVKCITDSREVAAAVDEWQPDLMILDLAMPHIDGFKILEGLRAQIPKQDWIPVLVLTAETQPDTRRKALAAGATEFLCKPFDVSEIMLRIRNLLLMRIYQSELRDQNRLLEYRVAARTKSLSERTAELEQAMALLERTQKQVVQQERFRAFGEMAGGVVHDFNNVLLCVIGYTDLLIGNPNLLAESKTVMKFLRTMNTAGHDAAKIVARLRNFYRPREEGDVFTLTEINKLLEEVVPLTQPKWKAQALADGRTIEIAFDFNTLPPVSCNAAEMREVAVNLVFNAVDAMPNGGTITLRSRTENGLVSIGISDTGMGMTEEVRQRCMEPFFSTKGEKGTGLGLAMVFGIVKRHEGRMEIESEVGKGTTIWIHFSAQLQQTATLQDGEIVYEGPLRILAVDDEFMARDIVSRYLEADGHQVTVAASAKEALDCFGKDQFDLVITDQAMPGMTGAQLTAVLKEKSATQPVLVLTGFDDATEEAAGLPPGVDMIASKAISHLELRHAIARTMQRSRAAR